VGNCFKAAAAVGPVVAEWAQGKAEGGNVLRDGVELLEWIEAEFCLFVIICIWPLIVLATTTLNCSQAVRSTARSLLAKLPLA
jgi:hypothetical protein